MTQHFGCGSRNHCRRTSPGFNRMEADLHNLYPSRPDANSLRGSLPFGEIPGERHDIAGCDFEIADVVEPRPGVRGDIARAVLYMSDAYGAELPPGQRELMLAWHRQDPPDDAERARNALIAGIQGTRNRFIEEDAPGNGEPPVTTDRGDRVRIATWNIANLHSVPGEPIPGRDTVRSEEDYARLRRIAAELDADIIALQEVNGPDAVHRVFPEDIYNVVVSDRFAEDRETGRQTDHIYTAVAVRKTGPVTLVASQT